MPSLNSKPGAAYYEVFGLILSFRPGGSLHVLTLCVELAFAELAAMEPVYACTTATTISKHVS